MLQVYQLPYKNAKKGTGQRPRVKGVWLHSAVNLNLFFG